MDQTPETTDLLAASKLVEDLVNGSVDFQHFVRAYDNYYYVAALDGHEGGESYREFLSANRSLVAFHEQVQMVLDKVYSSPPGERPVPIPAGRLSPYEAEKEITAVARKSRLGDELRRLDLKLLKDR